MKKEVASFTRRIIAYLIDVVVVNFLILSPFKASFNTSKSIFSLSLITKDFVIVSISLAALSLLYWSLLEYSVKQSLGKMITRIYVSSTKKQLTLKQCFIRNIPKLVGIVLFLDVLYALINKTHQRYFEKLSDTEVLLVKEEK